MVNHWFASVYIHCQQGSCQTYLRLYLLHDHWFINYMLRLLVRSLQFTVNRRVNRTVPSISNTFLLFFCSQSSLFGPHFDQNLSLLGSHPIDHILKQHTLFFKPANLLFSLLYLLIDGVGRCINLKRHEIGQTISFFFQDYWILVMGESGRMVGLFVFEWFFTADLIFILAIDH